MIDILMPALSPTMEEGSLAKWLVAVGDTVAPGDIIAEIETDKATMEVETADGGVVQRLVVPAGTEGVQVGDLIAVLSSAGAVAPPNAPAPANAVVASPPPSVAPPVATPPAQVAEPATEPPAKVFASPLARRLAALASLDLAGLAGSGPHGRILKRDVEHALGRCGAPLETPTPPARPLAPVGSPIGAPASPMAGDYDLVPLDAMRRTIARRMTDSARDIPHFPLTIDLILDPLLNARARLNAQLADAGGKLSVNDILIKAAARALELVPAANASYTPDGIALHHHADIAVAVALDGGLITPIVRAAETKSLRVISREMKDLVARARDRKLRPEEFQGGTFSISNLGMFGVRAFSSIINEPQGAILSVGAAEKRPIVKAGELAIATVMTVTLTCDHRVLDGAIGARFLSAFRSLVEDPLLLI